MSSAIIVGAGSFPRKEYPRYVVSQADHVVCCDGALATWLRVSPHIFGQERLPDAVVGDLDSLAPALQKKFADRVFHISEQDFNDQTKSLRFVLEHYPEVDEIHFIGASGKREDHTLGNLSLLMEYAKALDSRITPSDPLSKGLADALAPYRGRKLDMDIITDNCTILAYTDSFSLAVGEGRKVSIISTDNTLRIKSKGLQWQTSDVVFDSLWKATLNRATEDVISLTFSHPSAALIILS